MKIDLKVKVYK